MFVPCEWYYEYILGDNCNNQCEKCFGNKDIRICTKDFELRKIILWINLLSKKVRGGYASLKTKNIFYYGMVETLN